MCTWSLQPRLDSCNAVVSVALAPTNLRWRPRGIEGSPADLQNLPMHRSVGIPGCHGNRCHTQVHIKHGQCNRLCHFNKLIMSDFDAETLALAQVPLTPLQRS